MSNSLNAIFQWYSGAVDRVKRRELDKDHTAEKRQKDDVFRKANQSICRVLLNELREKRNLRSYLHIGKTARPRERLQSRARGPDGTDDAA
jgi:hypothetical protein